MAQSCWLSFVEANVTTWVGFILSVVIIYYAMPLFGFDMSWDKAFGVTLMFTMISIVRVYVIRRFFIRFSETKT